MTVSELIAELSAFPLDSPVLGYYGDGSHRPPINRVSRVKWANDGEDDSTLDFPHFLEDEPQPGERYYDILEHGIDAVTIDFDEDARSDPAFPSMLDSMAEKQKSRRKC